MYALGYTHIAYLSNQFLIGSGPADAHLVSVNRDLIGPWTESLHFLFITTLLEMYVRTYSNPSLYLQHICQALLATDAVVLSSMGWGGKSEELHPVNDTSTDLSSSKVAMLEKLVSALWWLDTDLH